MKKKNKPAKRGRKVLEKIFKGKANKEDQKWTSQYTQQGDCLVKKCGTKGVFKVEYEKIPTDAKRLQSKVILQGRNNSHAIVAGEVELFEKEGRIFLWVKETATLDHVKDMKSLAHAEHHAQQIPPGEYFIDAVMEFDHLKEESRPVID